ncbi:MAG: hypothetical protein QNJ05_09955 [Woeseiaceae bacterium]|nr:hypothetical protein [Woeseiaceae bacterium]
MTPSRTIKAAFGIAVLIVFPSICLASANVCEQPGDTSQLSLAYYHYDEALVGEGVGRTRPQLHEFDAQFQVNDAWAAGMGYRYVALGLDANTLQTNGHLHTAFFPIHRRSADGDNSFRLSVAPAMSASSNIIKNPDRWTSDAFQLLGAVVWRTGLSEQAVLRYGVCADSRLGRYKLYPTLGVDWQPSPDLRVELVIPKTRLSYKFSDTVSSSLQAAPAGNEWHVSSADFANRSDVEFEAILLEWTISWRIRDRLSLTARIGRLLDGEYEATLVDGRRVRASVEDANRLGASIVWRW